MSTPRKYRTADALAGELLPALKSAHISFTVIPTVSRFFSNHLCKLYSDFDGDLIMALVFSELSARNMSRVIQLLAAQQRRPSQSLETILREVEKEKMMHCNALSIAEATGIPRETVRRKIAELERKGWVVRAKRNMLLITAEAVERFLVRSEEMIAELLVTAQGVQQMLDHRKAAR